MKRIFQIALRGLFGVIVLIAVLWIADWISFQHRLSKHKAGDPLQTMRIQPTYAIPHKDGRVEYVFGEPQNVMCARSIFPHGGDPPCWYLRKTASKPIPM
ncbi:MAG TPA: hypothetical protein VFW94_14895 [Candidatus Acidoferrales bacterium]|nr:hypothetical protein [Candidatus Acidoferrales bacterium]